MPMGRREILFDTLTSIEELVAAGVPKQQAVAHVRLLVRLIKQKIASDNQHLDEPSQTARREILFDARAAAEELVAAGVPEHQADAHVRSLVQLMKHRIAVAAVI